MPVSIRLNCDLTRYHPGLTQGKEGTTDFKRATWGVWCTFPGVGAWDILGRSFDVTDEAYLEEERQREVVRLERLKHAEKVVLHLGPHGGLLCLSYELPRTAEEPLCGISTGDRAEIKKLLALFKQYGIAVKEEQEPKKKPVKRNVGIHRFR